MGGNWLRPRNSAILVFRLCSRLLLNPEAHSSLPSITGMWCLAGYRALPSPHIAGLLIRLSSGHRL